MQAANTPTRRQRLALAAVLLDEPELIQGTPAALKSLRRRGREAARRMGVEPPRRRGAIYTARQVQLSTTLN